MDLESRTAEPPPMDPTAQRHPLPELPPQHGMTLQPGGDGWLRLWAPAAGTVSVQRAGKDTVALTRAEGGWHEGAVPGLAAGDRYLVQFDDADPVPDPCSRSQPEGVYAPSAVVDLHQHEWNDGDWRGIPRPDLIFYELHIGTFTREGTCDAAIARLNELVELGVTAIEIMPVAQYPGERNWGYDGVFPFAVQASIGGAAGLQRLVDACHALGLAVILDVVYNHFGPEGCRLGALGPVFTDRYRTPWGDAVNLDGPDSDGVRSLLLANAWQWYADFHFDGLRLDAVHEFHDRSARPFLAELAQAVECWSGVLGRQLHLIAESDLNASRIVRAAEAGGYGVHAQWADDLHHALHGVLTGERQGILGDFGSIADLRKAYDRAFVYDGRWSAHRRRTHGDSAADLPTDHFVVCSQNHDQIGNRLAGERLSLLTDAAGLRCAAAAVLLSPYLPLLFMGEEYGETRPFLFFVDYGDPALVEAVRAGRSREFAAEHGDRSPPDPVARETWEASCLSDDPQRLASPLRDWYRACIRVRRARPSLRPAARRTITVGDPHPQVVAIERAQGTCRTLLLLNPSAETADAVTLPPGSWEMLLDSEATAWGGSRQETVAGPHVVLPPRSALLFAEVVRG